MRLRSFFILIVLQSCFSLSLGAQSIAPRSYTAYKLDESLTIDGLAEEKAWQLAPWSADFTDIKGESIPNYKTQLKMLWDAQHLYVYARMEEPHIWGTLKQRDTVIFYNNDFEMFIDPDGDTHNYMELEINALNTVWDLFLSKPYRENGKILDHWDIKGLKSAVAYQGTLNDPSDIDTAWTLEIAIPWEVLREGGGPLPENNFWRINFSRVQWQFDLLENRYQRQKDTSGQYVSESNWVWSPQGVINMHEPEHWGYVYFSSTSISLQQFEVFKIPKDEKIKWKMYQLYRAQKAYYHKHQYWATDLKSLHSEPLIVEGELLQPKLEVHTTGWNLSIRSPFTSNDLIIREDGYFFTNR